MVNTPKHKQIDEKLERANRMLATLATAEVRIEKLENSLSETMEIEKNQFSKAVSDIKAEYQEDIAIVRRQSFWERLQFKLSELMAHRLVDIKRLYCGIANAAV